MASVDMCEHGWPGSGCKQCFPPQEAEPDAAMARLTGDWFPALPRAYEKSVVLGGGKVLYPCADPGKTAEVLKGYAKDIAIRAFQAGKKAAKAEIRKALFD